MSSTRTLIAHIAYTAHMDIIVEVVRLHSSCQYMEIAEPSTQYAGRSLRARQFNGKWSWVLFNWWEQYE